MLTFRMDETNFADGDRAGVRIVTDTGLKVDFDEFAADGQTRGLWHLHDGGCQGEGTGLEDESGSGHDFTNHGAASVEDGYRFVRPESDWMQADFSGQGQRAQVTLEAWGRNWQNPNGIYGNVLNYGIDADTRLGVSAMRNANNPSASGFFPRLLVGGTLYGYFNWTGMDADAILAGEQPWHVALVLDADAGWFRLYVNGILRGQDTSVVPLLAGDYTLVLAQQPGTTTWASVILDEVRLSAAARYTQDFTPERLLASGTYTGPTFDGIRIEADWTDLIRTQTVPPGCTVAYDVRAADETDVNGNPQAVWQPYSGDPGVLPDRRYFQWRATLEADANRLASPTVEAVEAVASEAGYNLYHATGAGPESLDYDEPWAQLGPSVTDVETDALNAESVHWFGIRPVDPNGRESPAAQDEARLETGAQGEQEPDRPAGALAAVAVPLALGAARLRWRYRVGHNGVLPQTFRIFGDGGTGTLDYETPLDEVPWCEGQAWYAWTSDPLTPGVEHQLAVRAVTAGGVWDEQPAVARVTPDAVPPGQVDALEAEVTP